MITRISLVAKPRKNVVTTTNLVHLEPSTIQSRTVAGVIDRTLVFSMPGSPKACAMAWDDILAAQLDARTRPCNFVAMVVKDSQRCTSRSADHHAATDTGTTARRDALEVTP